MSIDQELSDVVHDKYLNYALSVITSRALPDVRDGLKPVQRRILYTMAHELSLHAKGRYRKSAAVVGDVMGKYHPHGDQSIYDALVRLSQDFSLRDPLVDGQGNFGSLDGDPAAAMRYTECRLTPLADALVSEAVPEIVGFHDSYDGQRSEPDVIPAPFPNLLVNGAEGIAVGMATKIPPHNLGEIVDATCAILRGQAHNTSDLLTWVRGPDFPMGGTVGGTREDVLDIYESGHGSFRIRADWHEEKEGRKTKVVFTSVPYGQNKAKIVEKIGEAVEERRLPLLSDVRDESSDTTRIVLELASGASTSSVVAWIFRHTGLESSFSVNFNAIVPDSGSQILRPRRLSLFDSLTYWIEHRFECVRRRLIEEQRKVDARIHILEGYISIIADYDRFVMAMRDVGSRKAAIAVLESDFGLTNTQAGEVADQPIWRLSKIEDVVLRKELADKQATSSDLANKIATPAEILAIIDDELVNVKKQFATPRRTKMTDQLDSLSYDANDFVVAEDTILIVSTGGWTKRQSTVSDLTKIRTRDTDSVGWVIRTDTKQTAIFLYDDGMAYAMRVGEVEATSWHGNPLTKRFPIPDESKLIGVVTTDCQDAIITSKSGFIQRLPTSAFAGGTTKNGKRYTKMEDPIHAIGAKSDEWQVLLRSAKGYSLSYPITEIPSSPSPVKGVYALALTKSDTLAEVRVLAKLPGYLSKISGSRNARGRINSDEFPPSLVVM